MKRFFASDNKFIECHFLSFCCFTLRRVATTEAMQAHFFLKKRHLVAEISVVEEKMCLCGFRPYE